MNATLGTTRTCKGDVERTERVEGEDLIVGGDSGSKFINNTYPSPSRAAVMRSSVQAVVEFADEISAHNGHTAVTSSPPPSTQPFSTSFNEHLRYSLDAWPVNDTLQHRSPFSKRLHTLRFEMYLRAPRTEGAGCSTRLESRMTLSTQFPSCCFFVFVLGVDANQNLKLNPINVIKSRSATQPQAGEAATGSTQIKGVKVRPATSNMDEAASDSAQLLWKY